MKKTQESTPDIRATFIAKEETIKKIKYISLMEDKLYKDVIADAFDRFIRGWEKKHGKINLK